MSKCLWTFIWVTYFLFFCLFLKFQIKILFQNNNNKHAHELCTGTFYIAWIKCHKPKRTAGAILLLCLVKYNDISVSSGFFNVCGWEQAPWHLWCTVSCWLAQAIWLMGNRATGTDFHSCSRWCQCAASTHHFSINGRSEVVCVQWHATFTCMFRVY